MYFDLKSVEDSITKFSGEDPEYTALRWAQQIGTATEKYSLSPNFVLLIAKRSLVSTEALWLRTENRFSSYEELKIALFKEFPEEKLDTERILDEMMKINRGESSYDYVLRIHRKKQN
ncbi:hypothetical protein K1T71_003916 [Dendrolimus kikuchii]|uniref:Uncharacterized protein n=1 Tax=Dendrolimus kikuchii TaxID=765133 RepID=A0ACC1D9H5_9NEOP|nr:hypothetical protein K1T71_003916 [Dendrolimus kikuchii]